MKFGFTGEEDDEESVPSHVGEIGQLTTKDEDKDDDDETGFTFTHHIYFAVHLGPFMFVVGRPE